MDNYNKIDPAAAQRIKDEINQVALQVVAQLDGEYKNAVTQLTSPGTWEGEAAENFRRLIHSEIEKSINYINQVGNMIQTGIDETVKTMVAGENANNVGA